MYCIQETDKPKLISKMFNIVQLTQNKIILPVAANETLSVPKVKKLAEKTKKVLDKTISKKIVVSRELQKQQDYMELLDYYGFEIVNGKWLFEILSCQALDYILEQKNMKKNELTLSILVNNLTENVLSIIRKIAKEYKRVNIVTNHIEKFKKIEEQILQKDGIMITVGNNKKKGISKSNVILNIDFSSKLINQYTIYDNAIIININENVVIDKKRFNGITINDYDITYRNFDNYDCDINTKYKTCEVYEAQMNKKQPFNDVMKQIKTDKVEIKKLIGKNDIY